ncbi:hypothetical protein T265_05052 [Opisthorchis viverrini]|uniref:Uncharacterized protein n=1 Tax=Opisthorchis viverrini TaxID=6198 RepID=A0A075AFQ4_OPIVI|nr:hypothetical protein T265_05052 [Opisthorchis viverrini]KER28004.1 hypothetical protein T265_05052 [Opisthorchis viverrini]
MILRTPRTFEVQVPALWVSEVASFVSCGLTKIIAPRQEGCSNVSGVDEFNRFWNDLHAHFVMFQWINRLRVCLTILNGARGTRTIHALTGGTTLAILTNLVTLQPHAKIDHGRTTLLVAHS